MLRFEERIRQLCKQVVACKTEAEAEELAQQLKALLHDRIEQLRGNLGNLLMVINLLDDPS